jgi:hypothetical protein
MIAAEDITGSWLLVERGASENHRAAMRARYGGHQSEGAVIFSPDGWMCAALGHRGRPPLPGNPDWQTDAPEAARLAAFDTFISYSGRWRIEAGQLVTKVAFALNPSWVGGEQVRGVELLDGGKMRLTVTRAWPDGEDIKVWIDWRRAD